MKKIVFIILAFAFTNHGYTQDILDGSSNQIIDGAYKKEIRDGGDDRLKQPYQHVRHADVMWSTKIIRVIDLREKMNQVFYYPVSPINDRMNLITVLMEAIKEGSLTAYGNATVDDEFKSPMSLSEVENIGIEGDAMEITEIYDDDIEDYVIDTTYNEFNQNDVYGYKVKEEWYFDKQRSVMDVRIIGLCPVMQKKDRNGIVIGKTSLFWVYFPEARDVLRKAEVFNHRKNDAARLTYDDIFHKRFFSSYIIKESNWYDRNISAYKTGIDALLESERIKMEIFNFEHDLWEY